MARANILEDVNLSLSLQTPIESQDLPTQPSHRIDHGFGMPTLLKSLCVCRTWNEMVVCERDLSEADFAFTGSRRAPNRRWSTSLLDVVLYDLPKKFQRVFCIRYHAIRKKAVDKTSGCRVEGDVIYFGDLFPCFVRRVFNIIW